MASKKTITLKSNEGTSGPIEILNQVSPLTIEFGREDLNLLRDKINEIISNL